VLTAKARNGVGGGLASDGMQAMTIPEALAEWATRTPERPAIVHGSVSVTYRELALRSDQAAATMLASGIGPGDRVVLVGDNSIEWVCAYLGGLRLGAVVAPANNRLSVSLFAQQCDLLDAGLVLADHEHDHLARGTGRAVLALSDLASAPSDGPVLDVEYPQPTQDAVVSFTSGTTGAPKGAVLTHESLFKGSRVWPEYLGTGAQDSTLILVPLFHNTGFVDQLGHMLIVGGQTHLLTRFRTADAVRELSDRPVTFLTAVPSILRLLTVAEDADAVYRSARIVEFGGSPMPAAWSEELLTRWPHLKLVHGYGLSEFTSVCTFLPPELIHEHGESVGRPAPGVDLKVTRATGDAGGVDEVGEVWVRGATRMSRYWNRPDLTAEKFSGDWLRTGDLGHLGAQGLLWLSGRLDDVINRGGEKVLPGYVESRVAELPEIAQASVFGFADPVLQQRIAVAVQLRPGASLDVERANRQLREALPDYAVPEQWVVYDELPRTPSGKTDRRAIMRDFHQGENSDA
jgi:acyl-CoA synthetase (AMP-forming)/AMP-acid ligase II